MRPVPDEAEWIRVSDALALRSTSWKSLPQWLRTAQERGKVIFLEDAIHIRTREGRMVGELNDLLIKAESGEPYPCRAPAYDGPGTGKADSHVHDPALCAGRPCCIHNPSNHHMLTWPQVWRDDRYLMERTCTHGVGHPDPDHIEAMRPSFIQQHQSVHACDGCCSPTS